MSRIYTHFIPFKRGASAPLVRIRVASYDFAIIGGAPAYGGSILLPAFCPPAHHVPGGFDGLPYKGDLGRPDVSIPLEFLQPVGGLYVATYSESFPTAVIEPYLVVQAIYQNVGSGNAVTRANVQLGGSYSVQLNYPAGQPLEAYLVDYPVGSVYTGLKAGYTLFSSSITPLQ